MVREAEAFWLPLIRLAIFLVVTLHGVLASAAPPNLAGSMPWWPERGVSTTASPLFFSWPARGNSGYVVEVEGNQEAIRRWSSSSNTYTPVEVFKPGEYRWRVVEHSGAPSDYSEWRAFVVRSDSFSFAIPAAAELLRLVRERKRPRSLPSSSLGATATSAQAIADLKELIARADRTLIDPLPIETLTRTDSLPDRKAQDAMAGQIRTVVFAERDRIERMLLAWAATGDNRYREDARRRVLNLAGWNPAGSTSFNSQDQASRAISWSLALALDRAYGFWSTSERTKIVKAVRVRMADFSTRLLDPQSGINVRPFDSHGVTGLGYLAAISVLMAGEDVAFDAMLIRSVPRYVSWPMPWGGQQDGGFSNGTAYAVWSATDFIRMWDVLQNATGLPIWQSAWARGFVSYLSHFLPPGAPAGVFGDETEGVFRKDWATVGKAIAARVPTVYSSWYWQNLIGEDRTGAFLYGTNGPNGDPGGTSLPNSHQVESIGWVAMHSDLKDRGRTSVFFKSSRYGSFNHSHADQNSFVIHSAGRPVAIDSGYYDYYGSPHWHGWYKQTLAHNAITYDGGKGQLHDTLASRGAVRKFAPGEFADMVTGDATEAYGTALSRAVRSLVYVRPGLLLVVDSLASATPRTWEWNLHSLEAFQQTSATDFRFGAADAPACVRFVRGPVGSFSQTDKFSVVPEGARAKQHHLRWSSAQPSRQALLLFAVDLECRFADLKVEDAADGGFAVLAGGRFLIRKTGEVEAQ